MGSIEPQVSITITSENISKKAGIAEFIAQFLRNWANFTFSLSYAFRTRMDRNYLHGKSPVN